ncbi:hypothetical protein D9M69_700470 [compost metagenome]
MDQRQVDVGCAQLLQAFLQAWNQLVLGVVGGPDLGGDEDLVARHAALGDGLADLGFVLIDLRRVDQAVAEFEAGLDRVDDDLVFQAEGAEAEGGDGVGVHGVVVL